MDGHRHREGAEDDEGDRDDRRLEPLDAELDVEIARVELTGEEELDPAEDDEESADERPLSTPAPEASGPLRPVATAALLCVRSSCLCARHQKHVFDPSVSSSFIPLRVKTDA
ncbi:hypothetical protein I6G94_15435 [Brevibacterium casei]|nr:hypothetical protein I6G94_15435 [Brevibacterium casei]QPR43083.1 hypothetical protein I6G93_13080 [Brevibacterium casei]